MKLCVLCDQLLWRQQRDLMIYQPPPLDRSFGLLRIWDFVYAFAWGHQYRLHRHDLGTLIIQAA